MRLPSMMTPLPDTSRGLDLVQGWYGSGSRVVANTLTTVFSRSAAWTHAATRSRQRRRGTGASRHGVPIFSRSDCPRASAGQSRTIRGGPEVGGHVVIAGDGGKTAVDEQHLAVDEIRSGRGQKDAGADQVLRRAPPRGGG